MKTKRRNPYNYKDVMNRDGCTECEAKQTVQNLKDKTSGSLTSFQNRYGIVDGEKRYTEFSKKSAHSKETFKHKYGDGWEIKWKEYLKSKDSMSVVFMKKKYGDSWEEARIIRIQSIIQSKEKMLERYGAVEGEKRFTDMNKKRSYSCSTIGLTEKHGQEYAETVSTKKSRPGRLNGMYGKSAPQGSGNGCMGWLV